MPNQKSSTAQDLARGKPSEIDFLNGYVVRKGAELGIPTPTNHALQVMVKLAERGKAMSRNGNTQQGISRAAKQHPTTELLLRGVFAVLITVSCGTAAPANPPYSR